MNPVIIGNATLILGDCVEVMAGMPENSLDAIVTDPPYLISFMSKSFDSQHKLLSGENEGQQMQVWHSLWAKEAYRVLKPGGYLIAAGGARTYHRLASAIEDIGFDLRDCIMWTFGCLDEQTELVTENGVKPYHKTKQGDSALCYNPDSGEYSYQPILEIFEYDYEDTAYRLIGDFGEQVVSRNHRVIVEQDGREVFNLAEEVARQREARIPILEDLQELQQALYGTHKGTSYSQQDLLHEVQGRTSFNSQNRYSAYSNREKEGNDCAMPDMREGSNQTECLDEETQRPCNLWDGMPGQVAIQDSGTAGRHERTGGTRTFRMDGGLIQELRRENDRGEESSLERRSDLSESQGVVCESANQVCSLPNEFNYYGEERRVCDGTQVEHGFADQSPINKNGGCSSYQSRCDKQSSIESDVICNESRPQTVRGWSGHKTVMVRIEPFHYIGKVWCIRVETGSFVAVRNGVAFPTGNSGFPKSLNVSKAIDKSAGLEREVIGDKMRPDCKRVIDARPNNFNGSHEGWNRPWKNDRAKVELQAKITAPASPESAQWEGFGTALKPAYEPFVMARKPLSESTVAANVLKHGTGAINIDACRVECEGKPVFIDGVDRNRNRSSYDTGGSNRTGEISTEGRWPPHLLLDGSDEVNAMFPETSSCKTMSVRQRERNKGWCNSSPGEGVDAIDNYGDSGSASRFFPHLGYSDHDIPPLKYCAKASKSDRGEYNTHPTCKPVSLMKWLLNLVLPPNGTVLDPFMGSGSTLKAACLENMKCMGIEMNEEYFEIAKARVEHAQTQSSLF